MSRHASATASAWIGSILCAGLVGAASAQPAPGPDEGPPPQFGAGPDEGPPPQPGPARGEAPPAQPAPTAVGAASGFERTRPRLSFTDGQVSFWRPGASDWAPALVNTPLASGDALYAAESSNLELQVGASAFVRAGEATQLGLTSLEPDFLQLRVTSGHLS